MKATIGLTCLSLAALSATPVSAGLYDVETKLVASDAATGHNFGISVAIDGGKAIVGSTSGVVSSSAYLFDVATGNELFQLAASDSTDNGFGRSVAISGNRAIVGAENDDDGGQNSGAAYLFDVDTGNEQFKLTASDAATDDLFGESVAISGNFALVGALNDDDNGSRSGSAYLFDVATGNELFKLVASDAAEDDFFGNSVAISGNFAIVGANGNDDAGSFSGAAYLFDVSSGNELFKLTASDSASGANFGSAVAISGNTAIVGALFGDGSGSAYLFDVTTGNELLKITASDGALFDQFGASVSLDGDTAIVGANADDDAGGSSGSAYLFDIGTGNELTKLTASDGASGDQFGLAVSISGNAAIVGAHLNNSVALGAGAAYLYTNIPEPNSLLLATLAALCNLAAARHRRRK